jgi:uncharacterized SAM-dependent methyltransferase
MARVLRNGAPLEDGDTAPSERAVTRLSREGILLPDKPEWPQENLPESLPALPDDNLIELFVRVTAWAGYLAIRSAAAMVDERAAETALEVGEAKAFVENWGGTSKDRVAVAKAERSADPTVVRLRKDYEDAYSYRKFVEVLAQNTDTNSRAVSRELTRRTSGPAPENRARRFHN